jgi:hypothetical protein
VNIQDGGPLAFSSRNISKTKQDMLKLQNNLLNDFKRQSLIANKNTEAA